MRFSQRRMAGFSLVEVVIVLAVGLVMAAVAVPTAMTQYRQYRLTSTAVHLANFLQRCRYDAIRLNTNVTCYYSPVPGGATFWADENNNFVADPTEPQYFFSDRGGDLRLNPPDAPGPASTDVGAGAIVPVAGVGFGTGVTFTPRGGLVPVGTSYIFSFRYRLALNFNGYRAVTISPVGKTKIYKANPGSNWWPNL